MTVVSENQQLAKVEEQQIERAAGLLSHYIGHLMRKAGTPPDSDTHAEIKELIEAIVEAAAARAKRDQLPD